MENEQILEPPDVGSYILNGVPNKKRMEQCIASHALFPPSSPSRSKINSLLVGHLNHVPVADPEVFVAAVRFSAIDGQFNRFLGDRVGPRHFQPG